MIDQKKILIVDDDPINIRTLAEFLKDDYIIKAATSGERCLEIVKQETDLDLILLDIQLTGMDGYEVCRQLKSSNTVSHIPVIFITGDLTDESETLGLNIGAVDYITKPVRPAIVAARVKTHIALKQHRDHLANIAMRDQLTKLYNRHYLLESANQKIASAKREKHALSLLMIDVDFFKTINDKYGHLAGDKVLISIASLLDKSNRQNDITARFGGEEFVLVLDHCNLDEAQQKAKKLRLDVEALDPMNVHVTVSIGVSELLPSQDKLTDLIARADQAVYKAKEAGRNCVVAMH